MTLSKKNISLALYFVVSCAYVFFRVHDSRQLMYIFKTLVVVMLTVTYLVSITKISRLYVLILVFQLIGDLIFVKEDIDSFMLGIGFFFIINILLSLMVSEKIGVINPKDIFKIFIPVLIGILSVVYVIFASVGFIKVLVLTFTLTVAILLSVAVKYYLVSKKASSVWMLVGVITMIACYIFAGAIRLISPHILFSVLEASAYCFSIFCYCRFVILEDIETVKHNSIQKR